MIRDRMMRNLHRKLEKHHESTLCATYQSLIIFLLTWSPLSYKDEKFLHKKGSTESKKSWIKRTEGKKASNELVFDLEGAVGLSTKEKESSVGDV